MQKIDNSTSDIEFGIPGLRFERNFAKENPTAACGFTRKLLSSPGPMISDFVTHEAGFQYESYGIHVGQDDRLTFMGDEAQDILGHFVDCRHGSATLHRQVALSFKPSLARRLIIPRGVAHTFDGLEGVVTRDEPVWHASESNKDWNVDNDLIAVQRTQQIDSFPIVRINEHRLPDAVHVFQSRLSQHLLQNPRPYLGRYLLTIGADRKYVMFEATDWGEGEKEELEALLVESPNEGFKVVRSRYALTGSRSWTLVPSTSSCVADVLLLPSSALPTKFVHQRTRIWYTVLNAEGTELTVHLLDCRASSETFGQSFSMKTRCDPRASFVIEPGMGYSIECDEDLIVRSEQEVFVDQNEPRSAIPIFGQDITAVADNNPIRIGQPPQLRCPDEIIRLLAKNEIANASNFAV